MNGKLRNMTSLYILKDDKVLLLYRQGSRVVNDKWVGSAGGHFEPEELNDAKVIDQDCWEKIIYFARKHNWMNETNDKWNIFHVMTKYKICIIPSISGKTDRKIAAIITVESIDGFSQKLNLYWELDSKYKNSEFLMPELSKGLEEKSIWKADYVLRWMDNELINAANEFYERDNLKNKKLFNQLIKIVGARLKEYFK